MKHCNGPCNQGRAPCPTPEACQLEDKTEDDQSLEVLGTATVVATIIVIMVTVLVWIA